MKTLKTSNKQRQLRELGVMRRKLVAINKWKRETGQRVEATACTIAALAKWLPLTNPDDLDDVIQHLVGHCRMLAELGDDIGEHYAEMTKNDDDAEPPIDAEFEDDPPAAEGTNGEPE